MTFCARRSERGLRHLKAGLTVNNSMDFSDRYDAVAPSVVKVTSYAADGKAESIGSGIAVGNGSFVVTCDHCITGAYSTVSTAEGREHRVSLHSPARDRDLALLKCAERIANPAAVLCDRAKVGQPSFCVGYPMGVTTPHAMFAHIAGFEIVCGFELIRLDASVNHGNSGGPLFDMDGRVMGIVNAKHGGLSKILDKAEAGKGKLQMWSGEMEVFGTLKEVITEMRVNLNLGIGYAIPSDAMIATFPDIAS
jgi:serine protease Do